MLSAEQTARYEAEGYLILRNHIDEADLARFERGFARNPPLDGMRTGGQYPGPGRYTLARSAFVVYDRTPGGPGLPAHHDYKRWRPVGSSMNWLFTIVPLDDFDELRGALRVAPGSHRLERVRDGGERALFVDPAVRPDPEAFIDPKLERGDLLLMNMHLWHVAPENRSKHHRVGIFNKYAAASAPPATGPYVFSEAAREVSSESSRYLIPAHADVPVATTRLVLERPGPDGPQVLMVQAGDGRWTLPGGPTRVEHAIPDWDDGNYIAALESAVGSQLQIAPPWVTYVGDFPERAALCRVYAYALNRNAFPVAYEPGARWFSPADMEDLAFGYEREAVARWLAPGVVRGKGISQARARTDQFAV